LYASILWTASTGAAKKRSADLDVAHSGQPVGCAVRLAIAAPEAFRPPALARLALGAGFLASFSDAIWFVYEIISNRSLSLRFGMFSPCKLSPGAPWIGAPACHETHRPGASNMC
jgi:hypothetical protein